MASPYVDAILRGIGVDTTTTPTVRPPDLDGPEPPGPPGPQPPGPVPPTCFEKCDQDYLACRNAGRVGCDAENRACVAACQGRDGPEPEGDCYKMGPTRPAYKDCQCGVAFPAPDGSKCPSNYTWVARGGRGWELWEEGMKGRCECTRWMEAHTPDGQEGEPLGEFDWPPELRALYERLIGRGGELLGRRPGFSDAILRTLFGRDFEKIRGVGGRGREEMTDWLASQGLIGTGAGIGIPQAQAWQTEKQIGDLKRDLAIAQEDQIRKDLLQFTGQAQGIFGQGMGYSQIREAINAARRGEGTQALEMILRLLQTQMAGWGG